MHVLKTATWLNRSTLSDWHTIFEICTGMPNEKADKFFSRICAARLAKDTHGAKIKICAKQEEANRSGNIEDTIVCDGDIGK
jgi:hypothetical protein